MKRRLPPANAHTSLIISSRLNAHSLSRCVAQVPTASPLASVRQGSQMEASFLPISPELRDALAKVAVFVLVQALVYLILRNSSSVFSKDAGGLRSLSFRPMRSMSVRRMLAHLSDVPVGTDEPSTSSPSLSSAASRGKAGHED